MNDGPTEIVVFDGQDSVAEDPANPEAMLMMINYLIPEARQVSPLVTILLHLARQELSAIAQEGNQGLYRFRGH